MEENKKAQAQKPQQITFEELKQYYGELMQRHQQLIEQSKQMQQALENREFDYMSFFVSMLFKVMDHPEMYNQEFTDWAAKEIEDALRSFKAASVQPENEDEKAN